MSKINLRDYLSGIGELIENGKNDEAIAHCRHILETYPKNVDTYRLMGKAYLESHRYGDAADIFQRVLSSCPGDFVAHIGMSIIREGEDNQDAAIWHMERAFEAQPSNRAVQDELRRLYGLREGFAPPKVRLTRGALARMYAHGDLYNQAITELRTALNEDPQRPDLQILLAEMYSRTGRPTDAMEICQQLIGKLPYCLYANHLMADILRQNRRETEAAPYLKVVEELDPYAAQAGASDPLSDVPANSIQVEHLVFEGKVPSPAEMPKSWTGSLEPIVEEEPTFVKEDLPAWPEEGPEQSVVPEEPESSLAPESDLAQEIEQALEAGPPPAEEPPAQAPQESEPLTSLELEGEPTGSLEPEAEPPALTPAEEAPPALTPTPEDAAPEGGAVQPSQGDIPEWLRELRPNPDQPADEQPEEQEEIPSLDSEELDWMKEFDEAGLKSAPLPGDMATQNDQSVEAAPAAEEPTQVAQSEDQPLSQEEEEGLGWLENLAARQGVSEEELTTLKGERPEEAPDWLGAPDAKQHTASLAWLDEMAADIDQQTGQEEPAPAQADALEPEAEAPASEASASEAADVPPEWLKDLAEEVESAPPPTPEHETDSLETPPQWLESVNAEADDVAQETPQPPAEEQPTPSTSDLSWLDELKEDTETEPESSEGEGAPAAAGDIAFAEALEAASLPEASEDAWVPESNLAEPELAEPEPVPAPAVEKASNGAKDSRHQLDRARQALNLGNVEDAAGLYGKLVGRRQLLDEIIPDLQAALSRHPESILLLQTLGDAYMRTDHLREALECYTRAEDLL